jgi:hypothetical protein
MVIASADCDRAARLIPGLSCNLVLDLAKGNTINGI